MNNVTTVIYIRFFFEANSKSSAHITAFFLNKITSLIKYDTLKNNVYIAEWHPQYKITGV
jgi:hypothetical protein